MVWHCKRTQWSNHIRRKEKKINASRHRFAATILLCFMFCSCFFFSIITRALLAQLLRSCCTMMGGSNKPTHIKMDLNNPMWFCSVCVSLQTWARGLHLLLDCDLGWPAAPTCPSPCAFLFTMFAELRQSANVSFSYSFQATQFFLCHFLSLSLFLFE